MHHSLSKSFSCSSLTCFAWLVAPVHEQRKRLSRIELIKKLRQITGDRLLLSTIMRLQHKVSLSLLPLPLFLPNFFSFSSPTSSLSSPISRLPSSLSTPLASLLPSPPFLSLSLPSGFFCPLLSLSLTSPLLSPHFSCSSLLSSSLCFSCSLPFSPIFPVSCSHFSLSP